MYYKFLFLSDFEHQKKLHNLHISTLHIPKNFIISGLRIFFSKIIL